MNKPRGIKRNINVAAVLLVGTVIALYFLSMANCAREASHKTTCINNINQLGRAETMYLNDNNEKFCLPYACNKPFPLGSNDTTISGGYLSLVTPWTALMRPYIKTTVTLLCPDQGEWPIVNRDATHREFYAGYGYNYLGLSIKGARPDPVTPSIPDYPQISLADVNRAANTLLFTDSVGLQPDGTWRKTLVPGNTLVDPPIAPSGKPGELLQKGTGWGSGPACYGDTAGFDDLGYGGVSFRHSGSPPSPGKAPTGLANVVFVDGHTRTMSVDRMTAGTNYAPNGCVTAITNPTAYLWDPSRARASK